MTIPTYVKGFPPDGSTLGNTKLQIRNNLDGTFETLAVDHYNNNDPNVGKHSFIQIPQQDFPSTPFTTGGNEIFLGNAVFNSINSLAYAGPGTTVNTAADLIQLTGPGIPSAVTNGNTFIPGGLVLNWGTASVPVGSLPIFFSQAYSLDENVFGVWFQSINTGDAILSLVTKTGFTATSSSGTKNIYWIALGK